MSNSKNKFMFEDIISKKSKIAIEKTGFSQNDTCVAELLNCNELTSFQKQYFQNKFSETPDRLINSVEITKFFEACSALELNFLIRPATTVRYFIFKNNEFVKFSYIKQILSIFDKYCMCRVELEDNLEIINQTDESDFAISFKQFEKVQLSIECNYFKSLNTSEFKRNLGVLAEYFAQDGLIPAMAMAIFFDDRRMYLLAKKFYEISHQQEMLSIDEIITIISELSENEQIKEADSVDFPDEVTEDTNLREEEDIIAVEQDNEIDPDYDNVDDISTTIEETSLIPEVQPVEPEPEILVSPKLAEPEQVIVDYPEIIEAQPDLEFAISEEETKLEETYETGNLENIDDISEFEEMEESEETTDFQELDSLEKAQVFEDLEGFEEIDEIDESLSKTISLVDTSEMKFYVYDKKTSCDLLKMELIDFHSDNPEIDIFN